MIKFIVLAKIQHFLAFLNIFKAFLPIQCFFTKKRQKISFKKLKKIDSINIVSGDMKIKGEPDSRRVVAFLTAKDMKLVLNLTFPNCYPLQKIQFRFSDDLKLKRK